MTARPLLKWPGGKTQLLDPIADLLPKRIKTYYEPFAGGAAVYFRLADEGRFEAAVLGDMNPELISLYQVVSHDPEGVIAELQRYPYSPTFFYGLRMKRPAGLPPIEAAARTIYLNKTGFNGLYRVNQHGIFNVPFGNPKGIYPPPRICDEENIRAGAKVLGHKTTFHLGDFADTVKNATEGDAVYFDPPYVPVSKTSNFSAYHASGFSLDAQERLVTLVRDLMARGVYVLLSNADTPVTRKLYEGLEIHPIPARRSINRQANKRGPVGELLVVAANPVSEVTRGVGVIAPNA